MLKINRAFGDVRYSQIDQSSSTTFTFVEQNSPEEYTELFWPVKCRDFLGDVVWSMHNKKKIGPHYGFSFNPEESPLDTDAFRLLVYFTDPVELARVLTKFDQLWEIENTNGLRNTGFIIGKDYLLLTGDVFWQSCVWAISLYTHIIRCLGSEESIKELFSISISHKSYRESNYMHSLREENWKKLTQNLKIIKSATKDSTGWNMEGFSSMVHDGSGIIALFRYPILGNKYSEAFNALPKL
jgi:hypothetical protein